MCHFATQTFLDGFGVFGVFGMTGGIVSDTTPPVKGDTVDSGLNGITHCPGWEGYVLAANSASLASKTSTFVSTTYF
jgi:hypothetical protein